MSEMLYKLDGLWPEIILGIGATMCLMIGLAGTWRMRRLTPWIAGLSLVLSLAIPMAVAFARGEPSGLYDFANMGLANTPFGAYLKVIIAKVGLLLLLIAAATPDGLPQNRRTDDGRERFDPGNVIRGEFFAFFLLSLVGAMLCAGADELVWLFLALELTSLPTYVMIAITRDKSRAQEAAVKYFFLGALAAAVFLYGFTLIYGATGFTTLPEISQYIAAVRADIVNLDALVAAGSATEWQVQQLASLRNMMDLFAAGLVISIIGICFKIAAVPMHFYAADVYQGAATPVTTFLAFVPKAAGFAALILLLGVVGWPLPEVAFWLLWIIAALTMTIGNVLGLLQKSVKRVLAYSSIAHSGYMLVGVLAGASAAGEGAAAWTSGVTGVLFYLVAYGMGSIGSFGVLALLERAGEEADTYEDIAGLAQRHRLLSAVMLVSVLSLIGLPPLAGFLGKISLFAPAMSRGETALIVLVIIAVLNSAISAVYYLRIAGACFFAPPVGEIRAVRAPAGMLGAVLAGLGTILVALFGGRVSELANNASDTTANRPTTTQHIAAEPDHSPDR